MSCATRHVIEAYLGKKWVDRVAGRGQIDLSRIRFIEEIRMTIRLDEAQRHGRAWRCRARWRSPGLRHLGAGAGQIGQDGDDRAAVGPVGAAGPAVAAWAPTWRSTRSTGRAASRALGGAKIELVVRRRRRQHREGQERGAAPVGASNPDLVGGTGAWLSSFTLAVTEVTERAQLPWLTLVLFRRDHRPRLQIHLPDLADRRPAGRARPCRPRSIWPRSATGKRPKTIGIIMDNTASPVSFAKPLREAAGSRRPG